jgi:putative inorganic carbon (hco3(-)) transporter
VPGAESLTVAGTRLRRGLPPRECGYVAMLAAVAGMAVVSAYLTSPVVPLIALATAAGAALSLWRPLVALHLAIAGIPLELFAVPVGPAALTPAEAIFALSGLGWAARRLATGQRLATPSALNAPLLLGLVPLAVGAILAEDRLDAQKVAFMWACFVLVFLMVIAEATVRTVRTLLLTLAASATAVAAVAIVRLGGRAPELVETGAVALGRATGSFTHPNQLAALFLLALPVTLVFAFSSALSTRVVVAVAFAVICAALLFSLSRGGILGVAGALLVLLAWRPVRNAAAILAVVIVGLTVAGHNPIVASPTFDLVTKRLESIRYTSAATGDDRMAVWRETPRIVADHPLFGVGAGNYAVASGRYGIVPSAAAFERLEHAHDVPLTVAAERGLIGLAALAWGTVALAVMLVRACRRRSGLERGMAFGMTAAFAGFALQGIVDYVLATNVIVALLFVLAGCATVLARTPAAEDGRGAV